MRTHDLGDVEKDPAVWPRIVLGVDDRLFIRARNRNEALKFISVFAQYVQAGPSRDHSRWTAGEVVSGEPHTVHIAYDEYKVRRVLAKIAYGLLFLALQPQDDSAFTELGQYVLGQLPDRWQEIVEQVSEAGSVSLWPEHHVAAVLWTQGRLKGIVSIFGSCHVVDLGAPH